MIFLTNISDTIYFLESFSCIAAGIMIAAVFLSGSLPENLNGKRVLCFSMYYLISGFVLMLGAYLEFYPQMSMAGYLRLLFFILANVLLLMFAMRILFVRILISSVAIMFVMLLTCGIMTLTGSSTIAYPFFFLALPAHLLTAGSFLKLYYEEHLEENRRRFLFLLCLQILSLLLLSLQICPALFPAGRGDFWEVTMPDYVKSALYLVNLGVTYVFASCLMTEKEKPHPFKSALSFFAANLLFALFVFSLPSVFHYYAKKHVCEREQRNTETLMLRLDSRMKRISELAESMASMDVIQKFAASNGQEFIAQTYELLGRHAFMDSRGIFYILNSDGKCIASSNSLLLNSNFRQRSYFSGAMGGGNACMIDRGLLTNQAGFYAASRIESETGTPIGVLCVKTDTLSMPELSGLFYFFVSPENRIRASSLFSIYGKDASLFSENDPIYKIMDPMVSRTSHINRSDAEIREDLVFTQARFNNALRGWSIIIASFSSYPSTMYIFGIRLMFFLGLLMFSLWLCIKLILKKRENDIGLMEWKDAFFADNPLPMFLLDDSFKLIDANDAMGRFFGYDRKDFLLLSTQHLFSSKDEYAKFHSAAASLLLEKNFSNLKLLFRKRNLKSVTCRASATLFQTRLRKNNSLIKSNVSLWTLFDETQTTRQMNILKLSDGLYRSLSKSTPEHMFLLDRNGRFLASNDPRISSRIGKQESSASPPMLSDYYSNETVTFYKTMLENVFVMRSPLTFQHSVKIYDSENFYLDTLYPIIRNGSVTEVGGISRDITTARRTENSLRKLELRFIDIGRYSNDIFWETDVSGRLIFCSENISLKLGRSVRDLIGADPMILLSEEFHSIFYKRLAASIREKAPFTMSPCSMMTASGNSIPILMTCVPVFDDFGKCSGIRGICTDMTFFHGGETSADSSALVDVASEKLRIQDGEDVS